MSIVFLLAMALSIDSLTVGLTYGLRKVKIPFLSLLILFFCAFCVLYTSIFLGQGLTHVLSEQIASFIGGLLLVLLGAWMLFQKGKEISQGKDEVKRIRNKSTPVLQIEIRSLGLMIQILKTPTLADFDGSGRITGLEAFMLGLALSIDSFGAGIGMGVLGFNPVMLSALVAFMSVAFLYVGVDVGRRFSKVNWLTHISAFSGLILIIMGFLRM